MADDEHTGPVGQGEWRGPMDVLQGRRVAAAGGRVIKDREGTAPADFSEWLASKVEALDELVSDAKITKVESLLEIALIAGDIVQVCQDLVAEHDRDAGTPPEPQDGWVTVRSVDEALALRTISYPMLVKAAYVEGAEGVRVRNESELVDAIRACLDASPTAEVLIRVLPFVEDTGTPSEPGDPGHYSGEGSGGTSDSRPDIAPGPSGAGGRGPIKPAPRG